MTYRAFICVPMLFFTVLTLHPAQADAACENVGVLGTPYGGFAGAATGGAGQPVYVVNNLTDPVGGGVPGTLRHALASGNRCIQFAVSGEITLNDTDTDLRVRGASITIDGFTAPAPGITIRRHGILVWGTLGARNVIIRGIRVREAGQYSCDGACSGPGVGVGFSVSFGARTVVLDHVSTAHQGETGINITKGAKDVTVSNSIIGDNRNLADPRENKIFAIFGPTRGVPEYDTRRVSIYRTLMLNAHERTPRVSWTYVSPVTEAPEIMLDMRNNLIWHWRGSSASATKVMHGAKANIIGNYYYTPETYLPLQQRAIMTCYNGAPSPACSPTEVTNPDTWARTYIDANVSGNSTTITAYLNKLGTESAPFPAAPIATTDACTAAYDIRRTAGARGPLFSLDAIDAQYVAQISTQLPGCPEELPQPRPPASDDVGALPDLVISSLSMPSTLYPETGFPVKFMVINQGAAPSAAAYLKIYSSQDNRLSSDDVLLRVRSVAPLGAGESQFHALTETVPFSGPLGPRYILLVVDSEAAVAESNEANNTTAVAVTVAAAPPIPDLLVTSLSMPSLVYRDLQFKMKFTITNRGTAQAGDTRLKIYLSRDKLLSADDVLLRVRSVASIAPSGSQYHALGEVIPTTASSGAYYILIVVDCDSLVKESNESNNTLVRAVTVR